ncbi:MAG: RNA polymerase sigma factor [Chloroflexi bacterium]|nr:RNA polymerase sigma factor [Chloroflexota bacterium]
MTDPVAEACTGGEPRAHEAELLARAKEGDREAFSALYAAHFDAVYDFVGRLLGDPATAEDVTQDTFLKAMQALGGLKKADSFRSWLFTIAYHRALNHRRMTARGVRAGCGPGEGVFDLTGVRDHDPGIDPQERAERAATATLVWEAALGLEAREYAVLDLHLRRGFDTPEIAATLGISKNHAAVILMRSRHALADATVALLLLKEGRAHCPRLDRELPATGNMSPGVRKIIDRHRRGCERCQVEGIALARLEAAFGALAPVAAAAAWKAGMLAKIGAGAIGGSAAGAGAGVGVAAGAGVAGGGAASMGTAVLVGAAVVAAAISATVAVIAPWQSSGGKPAAAADVAATTPTATPPLVTATLSPASSPTAAPSPASSPTPAPSPSPAAAPPPQTPGTPVAPAASGESAGGTGLVARDSPPVRSITPPARAAKAAEGGFPEPTGTVNAVVSGQVAPLVTPTVAVPNLELPPIAESLAASLPDPVAVVDSVVSSAVAPLATILVGEAPALVPADPVSALIPSGGNLAGAVSPVTAEVGALLTGLGP